ncbi:MAG: hypothetical protein K0V04_10220 [Deltaproteobacteria bacterium]|nr:hypothetical protein [Deltaproteobacteria bacterium]
MRDSNGCRGATALITVIGGVGLSMGGCSSGDAPRNGSDGVVVTEGDSESDSEGLPDRSPVVEQVVPLDLATTPLTAQCFDLEAAPQQWSVAPQGQLWLRMDAQTWRVVDRFGADGTQLLPTDVEALQAHGSDRALAIIDGQLTDIVGQLPLPMTWPESLAAPVALCGDPSTDGNGFVVAQGLVHRDRGQWWSWTSPAGEAWADVAWLAQNGGACIGADDELWLGRDNGEAWRITGDLAVRVESLDDAQTVVLVDPLGAAAIVDQRLLVGDHGAFTDYRFEAGEVSAISAGGESLWVRAGGELHRLLDGEFTHVQLDDAPVEAETLIAEAGGGLWTMTDGEVCHLRPAPPVRVAGIQHLQRWSEEMLQIAVELDTGSQLGDARLDDAALTLTDDGMGQLRAAPQTMDEGWHLLEIDVNADGAVHTRRLRFEQRRAGDVTWEEHIQPLFEEHCSGGACHGPSVDDGTRPDLSSYAEWLDRENSILERVVVQGDMPPFGSREPTWVLDTVLTVAEWFETGAEQDQ